MPLNGLGKKYAKSIKVSLPTILINVFKSILKNKECGKMITNTNKFLLELFNVPAATKSENFSVEIENIAHWNLQKIEPKDGEHVAYIVVILNNSVPSDSLDGEVMVSATNYDVQGVDVYVEPMEPIPMSFSDQEDMLAQSEGWALFDADGKIELQRIDELGIFSKDEDAHEYVKVGAVSGSSLHLKAKEILMVHNPKEHDLVFGQLK
jgi:hypothetical protein